MRQKDQPDRRKRLLSNLVGWFFAGLVIVSLILGDYIYQKWHDANTSIESAEVMENYKYKAGRRSLPSYGLVIQEIGKSDQTKVSVNLSLWVMCDPGDLYTDLPGAEAECIDPELEKTLKRIKEFNERMEDYEPYKFEDYIPPSYNS